MKASDKYPQIYLCFELGNYLKILEGWGSWAHGCYPGYQTCSLIKRNGANIMFTDDEMLLTERALAALQRQHGKPTLKLLRSYYVGRFSVTQIARLMGLHHKTIERRLNSARRMFYNLLVDEILSEFPQETELLATKFASVSLSARDRKKVSGR